MAAMRSPFALVMSVALLGGFLVSAGPALTGGGQPDAPEMVLVAEDPPATVTETVTVTQTETVTGPTVTETVPGPTVTQTVPGPTVTVTAPPPPAVVPPPTTEPDPPTGAEMLAEARRISDRKVFRLASPALTPGVAYVERSIRKGRGTLTVANDAVVPLLVLACPRANCDAGVSAKIDRRTKSGKKAKRFSLRRATFSLDAGRMRLVAVRLTHGQRRAIRAARSARLTVTIAVSDEAGTRSKRTLRLGLRIRAR